MQKKFLNVIGAVLTLFLSFPTFVEAQNKTQFATFHGFDHRNNSITYWQWGKIMTVDNLCVPSTAPWYARDLWGHCEGSFDPIQVTPGTHILSVSSAYSYGFMRGPYTGQAQFKVNFSAGHHYFLNGNMIAERTIQLWIEDAKGKRVSNVVTASGEYSGDTMALPAIYTHK